MLPLSTRTPDKKVTLREGKSIVVPFNVGYAPTVDKSSIKKGCFISSFVEVVKEVPSKNHILVLMDSNARTGIREIEWAGSKVFGAYGRDKLNSNGERLLINVTDNKLALLNTSYATPARSISYGFQSPDREKAQDRLAFILARQVDRRLVRNVTVQTQSREEGGSDNNLVIGNIPLLGRIAPNRPKIVVKSRGAVDLSRLLADPHLRKNFQQAIAAKLASPMPGTNTGYVDDLTSVLTCQMRPT